MIDIGIKDKVIRMITNEELAKKIIENVHKNGWIIERHKNTIVLKNKLYCMNENGFCVYVQPFAIKIPKNIYEFSVSSPDKNRYWWNKLELKEYIEDTIASLIDEINEEYEWE